MDAFTKKKHKPLNLFPVLGDSLPKAVETRRILIKEVNLMSDSKSKKTKTKDPLEPGATGFPGTSSVMPGDGAKDDGEVSPCAPGAPCNGEGGGGSEDPNTSGGGGKSGLSIRPGSVRAQKTDSAPSNEEPISETPEHHPGRMVMFYLETDNICIESLGMDSFFNNLAQRAKAKS